MIWRGSSRMRLVGRLSFTGSGIALILLLHLCTCAFGASYTIAQVVAKSYDDFDALIITLNQESEFGLGSTSSGGLRLSVADCILGDSVPEQGGGAGLIAGYSVSYYQDVLYMDISLIEGAGKYKGYLLSDPARIVIKIFPKGEVFTGDYPSNISTEENVYKYDPKEIIPDNDLAINTICIDPGHGGRFSGAVGPTGVMEKDVNLRISLKLKNYLEKELGVTVYLCRYDDSMVYLADRTGLANDVKADLFISIHNNAYYSSKANGTETFFLSESRTDDERAVAVRENEDFLMEDPNLSTSKLSDLEFILAAIAQNEFLEESSELAELVQQALIARLGSTDRGVKQAPFFVLVGCYMPAILVEGLFISNPEEEEKLNDPYWQDLIARAVYEGVAEFKKRQEKRMGIK